MKRIWSGVLATAIAGTVSAQGPVLQPKLAELQPAKFSVPLCPLKTQGSVQKGVDALRKAFEPKAARAVLLTQAKDLILLGMAKEAQTSNAAAWYYLARVYLMQGDIGGVDSTFRKAQELQPQCEIDIDQYRQNNWALLANAGLEVQKAGHIETAIVLFRDADRLYQGKPHVASNLGVLFANSGKDDSAAVYFAKAMKIAESDLLIGPGLTAAEVKAALGPPDSSQETKSAGGSSEMWVYGRDIYIHFDNGKVSAVTKFAEKGSEGVAVRGASSPDDRNSNAMNLALMYQRLDRHKDAVPILKKYLGWKPSDMDARRALSQSLRAGGMVASADSLELAMVGEMSKQNLDSLDTQDILAIGVAAFNASKHSDAAKAFSKAVARNPFSRDAVYNLANAYLALKDNENLVKAATMLVDIEPMNEDVYRLQGQGFKGLKRDADVLKAAEKLVGLQVTIEMTGFQLGRATAKLEGTATGRAPTDAQGKVIKPAAVTIVVEFVTSGGAVVDTKEVALPVLAAGTVHKISLDGKGADIAGWRYRGK